MQFLVGDEGLQMGPNTPDGPKVVPVGEDYVDPLAKPRPKYDLCAASGRPEEVCCGAVAPQSPAELSEWTSHMLGEVPAPPPAGKLQPLLRTLALLSDSEASARSPDGTAAGYDDALRTAGFTSVARVDLVSPGSRALVLEQLNAAKAARERICVHCVDGTAMTSVVMADWLLTDYIGGDNTEEAAETLRSRKRLGGVERLVDPELVTRFIEAGTMGDVPPGGPSAGDEPPPDKVSPGGVLLI